MSDKDNIVPLPTDGQVRWSDSFVNLLAGLGVPGRDKFSSQAYSYAPLNTVELESAYRGDWIARKVINIPAQDMTREWRSWQADPDQIQALEELESKLLVSSRVYEALVKARLYGGAIIIIGVDAGNPEDELNLDMVKKDSLKFLHIVSRNNITTGPIIYDISSKYYGQPEYYEAHNQTASRDFQQAEKPLGKFSTKQTVKLHPSRVVKLIGMDTADQMLSSVWGDSALQPINDAIKMCGLVTGSLATLMSELKIDIIKIPELKSILSTQGGTDKMIARFSAANAAKSVVNTLMIDGNEEWQRINTSFAGIPEVIQTYMQMAAGAADIPATRFLGMAPRGLNATGESDIRNYYDRLAAEQNTVLTPTMNALDEVIIRAALGTRPPNLWYTWDSLWQLTDTEKADVALKKAQAYNIDVNAAQLPAAALANARANQLIEDGTYPGLEQALDDAALEGDTIEETNKPPPPMDPSMLATQGQPPPGQPGGPPGGQQPPPFPPKKPNPFAKKPNPFAAKKPNPFTAIKGGKDSLDGVNRVLRGKEPVTPQARQMIDELDDAFDMTATPFSDSEACCGGTGETFVWRGIGDGIVFSEGDAFSDHGFVLAVIDRPFSGRVARIEVPAGHPVADLGDGKVILGRGTTFRVVKAGETVDLKVID